MRFSLVTARAFSLPPLMEPSAEGHGREQDLGFAGDEARHRRTGAALVRDVHHVHAARRLSKELHLEAVLAARAGEP